MKTSIPIYVINLKRNPERKLFMQRQLDVLDLNYQFVDGIDKFDLESPKYRAQISEILGITATNLEYKYSRRVRASKINKKYGLEGLGHIACLLSHIKIYNLMLKNGDDVACVLEDDAFLLPTFPKILAVAPQFSSDILMLSHHSSTIRGALEKFNIFYRRIIKSYNYALFIKSRYQISDMHKQINELLGISHQSYPKLSKAVKKILQEFNNQYKEILELDNPKQNLVWFMSSPMAVKSYKNLLAYTTMQLGGLPSRNNHQAISEHYFITEPKEKPTSGMAYVLNRLVVEKWKTVATSRNTLAIDSIPWHLYTNRQAKLHLVSLPCVIGAYHYQKYSLHQKYYSL